MVPPPPQNPAAVSHRLAVEHSLLMAAGHGIGLLGLILTGSKSVMELQRWICARLRRGKSDDAGSSRGWDRTRDGASSASLSAHKFAALSVHSGHQRSSIQASMIYPHDFPQSWDVSPFRFGSLAVIASIPARVCIVAALSWPQTRGFGLQTALAAQEDLKSLHLTAMSHNDAVPRSK